MFKTIGAMILAGTLITISLPDLAQAQPGPHGKGMFRGGGMGGGHRGFRGGRCRKLLRAHPDVLKAKFGFTDAQIKKIHAIQDNFASKRIAHGARAMQLKIKLRRMMQQDTPNEARVLALHRQIRALRGKIAEEGIKARIRTMGSMTKQQRTQFRQKCGKHGKRGWQGKRGRGGRGWGRGPRGPGKGPMGY